MVARYPLSMPPRLDNRMACLISVSLLSSLPMISERGTRRRKSLRGDLVCVRGARRTQLNANPNRSAPSWSEGAASLYYRCFGGEHRLRLMLWCVTIGVAAKMIGSLPSAFFVALNLAIPPIPPALVAGIARAARLSWPSTSTFTARERPDQVTVRVSFTRDAGTGFAALLDVSGLPNFPAICLDPRQSKLA